MTTIGERVAKRKRGLEDKVNIILLNDKSGSTGNYGRFVAIQKYVEEQLKSHERGEIKIEGLFYFSNLLEEIEVTNINVNDLIKEELSKIYPNGCTSLYKYIHEIGEKILVEKDGDLSKISFVVVTDGENTTDANYWDQAITTIKKLKDRNCKILYAGIESDPFTEISNQALKLGYPEDCVLSINCYDKKFMENGLNSLRQVSTSLKANGFTQIQRNSSQPTDDLDDLLDSNSILPPPAIPIDKRVKLNRLGAPRKTVGGLTLK